MQINFDHPLQACKRESQYIDVLKFFTMRSLVFSLGAALDV